MPDLSFQIDGAEPVRAAASPLLGLKLRVTNREDREPVHTTVLRCQIHIEAARRRYNAVEQERLFELFDAPHRWGQTLRALLWTNTTVIVPPFLGCAVVDVELPCTMDINVATTKYFCALEGGEVSLLLLFNGTVFYSANDGALRVAPIPLDKEARYRMPVEVWQRMMDSCYPNSAWLSLRRDVFERLCDYKAARRAPTWEEVFETLLDDSAGSVAAEASRARNGR